MFQYTCEHSLVLGHFSMSLFDFSPNVSDILFTLNTILVNHLMFRLSSIMWPVQRITCPRKLALPFPSEPVTEIVRYNSGGIVKIRQTRNDISIAIEA